MSGMFSFCDAMSPFFDEHVSVVGDRVGRTIRGTYAACVFPVAQDDPFADNDADTDRMKCSVLIAKRGDQAWNDVTPPQIGDKVTLENGGRFAISKVNPLLAEWYELEVRSC